MWIYEKRLQFPVNIQNKNARLAKAITSQLGGPDGELAASMRYFAQRYAMPDRRVAGLLNDVATEELAHLEMIGTIIRQLTKGLSAEESNSRALTTTMLITLAACGMQVCLRRAAFTAAYFQSKGDR